MRLAANTRMRVLSCFQKKLKVDQKKRDRAEKLAKLSSLDAAKKVRFFRQLYRRLRAFCLRLLPYHLDQQRI